MQYNNKQIVNDPILKLDINHNIIKNSAIIDHDE
jgi:hypothetical protein